MHLTGLNLKESMARHKQGLCIEPIGFKDPFLDGMYNSAPWHSSYISSLNSPYVIFLYEYRDIYFKQMVFAYIIQLKL